jgi:glutamine amidotransferase
MSENKNSKVVIIDYELGNLFSVNQALEKIGLQTLISKNPIDINDADAIILPGVGAFGDAMKNLNKLNLIQPIQNFIDSGKPFLGICLGLQLLFTKSEEFGSQNGLNIIKGVVKKFPSSNNDCKIKVPQISWNKVFFSNQNLKAISPMNNISDEEYYYFVHSFYIVPEEDVTLTNTEYSGIIYSSSILKNNIFACQFHPEKSGPEGLKIYQNWAIQNNLI